MDKFYKVVSHYKDEQYLSYAASGKALVHYQVGEWAEAPEWLREKGYHLLVFEELRWAEDFVLGPLDTLEIWEVEVEDRVSLPIMCDIVDLTLGDLHSAPVSEWWPHGTRMYKRVKLVKKIAE